MNIKICLFTAHSPIGGGGSVILRSLIKYLPEININWKYSAKAKVLGYEDGYLGPSFMGAGIIRDIWGSFKMLTDLPSAGIKNIVNQLLSVDCDAYWIVSHNEGLRVAIELARVQSKRPVHLTVHDDWAGALSARSFRYRLLAPAAKTMTIKALKRVNHFDVISNGMQKYYEQISGMEGEVCHRYLPAEAINNWSIRSESAEAIQAGHIGSIYDKHDFFEFIRVFQAFAKSRGKKASMNMWGYRANANEIPADLKETIVLHEELPEEQVVPKLAQFDFVYAMYPMEKKMNTFSITSLPTKLTSYLQCGRPIFGHAPDNSTLSEFLTVTGTGFAWSDMVAQTGMTVLNKVLGLHLEKEVWENARQAYFGEKNLAVMRDYFRENSI